MNRRSIVLPSILLVALLAVLIPSGMPLGATQASAPVAGQARVQQAPRSGQIMFIENVGQFAESARFQVRGGNGAMWLAEDALWITVIEPENKGAGEQGSKGTRVSSLLPPATPPRSLQTASTFASPSLARISTRTWSHSTGWINMFRTFSAMIRPSGIQTCRSGAVFGMWICIRVWIWSSPVKADKWCNGWQSSPART